jgi:WD40 repeat protein
LGTIRFRHEGYGIQGLAFLPDGKTLVAGEQNSVRFWETATGRRLGTIAIDLASLQRFTLSPDGKQIAVAGTLPQEDNRPWEWAIQVLDVSSRKKVRTFSIESQKGCHAMAFTPDGKFLVMLDGSGILRIEEIASGVEILRQQFPGDVGAYLAISPVGGSIAVASRSEYAKALHMEMANW